MLSFVKLKPIALDLRVDVRRQMVSDLHTSSVSNLITEDKRTIMVDFDRCDSREFSVGYALL